MPRRCAVRNSAVSIALAMPRRRWVDATVTALIAHAEVSVPPGTVSRAGHELTVATGDAESAAESSKTPVVRRSASPRIWAASDSADGLGWWNPRESASSQCPKAAPSLVSTSCRRSPPARIRSADSSSIGRLRYSVMVSGYWQEYSGPGAGFDSITTTEGSRSEPSPAAAGTPLQRALFAIAGGKVHGQRASRQPDHTNSRACVALSEFARMIERSLQPGPRCQT